MSKHQKSKSVKKASKLEVQHAQSRASNFKSINAYYKTIGVKQS